MRPRRSDPLVEGEVRPDQRSERLAVWRRGSADVGNPPTEVDHRLEEAFAVLAAERQVVEMVDLALDFLDQREVARQHGIDQRRDE